MYWAETQKQKAINISLNNPITKKFIYESKCSNRFERDKGVTFGCRCRQTPERWRSAVGLGSEQLSLLHDVDSLQIPSIHGRRRTVSTCGRNWWHGQILQNTTITSSKDTPSTKAGSWSSSGLLAGSVHDSYYYIAAKLPIWIVRQCHLLIIEGKYIQKRTKKN